MSNDNGTESASSPAEDEHMKGQAPRESGYGAPAPEDEVAPDAATNPGPADPRVDGQQTDEQALDADRGLGMPEPNFADNEDAGSDGELGAGRLGGTDEQFRDEMAMAPDAARSEAGEDTPIEAPSTEAPLKEDNAGPTRAGRESFSSETDEDASGE
ncbi:hypothetical protein [Arthrobacter alpinus]|uniref:hypothetical protein n=1 Tax=Arthrobacter alpinus TaxID=656366 RepID=UPI000782462F|nr:hypothetical protein [Arthrobacter alpinus]